MMDNLSENTPTKNNPKRYDLNNIQDLLQFINQHMFFIDFDVPNKEYKKPNILNLNSFMHDNPLRNVIIDQKMKEAEAKAFEIIDKMVRIKTGVITEDDNELKHFKRIKRYIVVSSVFTIDDIRNLSLNSSFFWQKTSENTNETLKSSLLLQKNSENTNETEEQEQEQEFRNLTFDLMQNNFDLLLYNFNKKCEETFLNIQNNQSSTFKYIESAFIRVGDEKLNLLTSLRQKTIENSLLKMVGHTFTGNNQINQNAPHKTALSGNETDLQRQIHKKIPDGKGGFYQPYITIAEEQLNAARACVLTDSMISCVQGYAGAGKSFVMGLVTKTYQEMGFVVQGVALSAQAASVLEAESGVPCMTVSKLIYTLKQKADHNNGVMFQQKTVLIIDEAGLVGLPDMYEILKHITNDNQIQPVKIILSGDSTQLNPISVSNSLELIEKVVPRDAYAVLKQIRRQKSKIDVESVLKFQTGVAGQGLWNYLNKEQISVLDTNFSLLKKVLQDYFNSVLTTPTASRLILCQDNDMVRDFNEKVREILQNFNQVGQENCVLNIQSKDGKVRQINISVGDSIVFTKGFKNVPLLIKEGDLIKQYKQSSIMNGLRGKIIEIRDANGNKINPLSPIQVKESLNYFLKVEIPMLDSSAPNGEVITFAEFNTNDIISNTAANLDLNYAMTVYSSQGQTVDETFIVHSNMFDSRNAYVAMSRHRNNANIYVSKEHLNQYKFKSIKLETATSFDILDEVARIWSTMKFQHSMSALLLKKHESLAKLLEKDKNQILLDKISDIDYQNLIKNNKEQTSLKIQDAKMREQDNIIDSIAYYTHKPLEFHWGLLSKSRVHQQQINSFVNEHGIFDKNNQRINQMDIIPLKQQNHYYLHPMINKEFFDKYENVLISVGRGAEIRFLGITEEGRIMSKYNINGIDALGTGYPVMAHNGNRQTEKQVYIIEDLNLYLDYLKNYYLDDNQEENKPILIWGAKTTDYKHITTSVLPNATIKLIGSDVFKLNSFIRLTHSSDIAIPMRFENLDRNEIYSKLSPSIGYQNTPLNGVVPVLSYNFSSYCNYHKFGILDDNQENIQKYRYDLLKYTHKFQTYNPQTGEYHQTQSDQIKMEKHIQEYCKVLNMRNLTNIQFGTADVMILNKEDEELNLWEQIMNNLPKVPKENLSQYFPNERYNELKNHPELRSNLVNQRGVFSDEFMIDYVIKNNIMSEVDYKQKVMSTNEAIDQEVKRRKQNIQLVNQQYQLYKDKHEPNISFENITPNSIHKNNLK